MKKFLYLLLLLPVILSAQKLSPESALEQFSKYPQERIFIQFDKNEYLAGDVIHFRSYVFFKYSLTRISTNVYVELLDDKKEVILKNMYPLSGGIASGAIEIPDKIAENIYYIRAYTSWMLNFNEKFQYIQPIQVYKPNSTNKLELNSSKWTLSAQPEGGTLLDSTEAIVAVRLFSQSDFPEKWTGFLYEENTPNEKLIEFESLNSEVGIFSFTPYAGDNYFVKVIDSQGDTQVAKLKPVATKGISLNTAVQSNRIAYRIESKNLPNKLLSYKILAHIDGTLIYSAIINSENEEINGIIPITTDDKGLVHITVFDENSKPIAERLNFVSGKTSLSIEPNVEFDVFSRDPRGENEWNLTIDSIFNNAYTVLISNKNHNVKLPSANMLNVFWLDALSNTPKSEFDYLKYENRRSLEALLMSEKWNYFNWEDLLSNPLSMQYYPDNFLSYNGTVTIKNNIFSRTRPLPNENVTVLFQMNDSASMFTRIDTDSLGRFSLKNVVFYDTARVSYHITEKLHDPIKIDIDFEPIEHFVPYQGALPDHPFVLTRRLPGDTLPNFVQNFQSEVEFYKNLNEKHIVLDSIVVTARSISPKEKLNRELSSMAFQSPDERVFDLVNGDDVIGFSVFDYLHSRVAGLLYEGGNNITIRGEKPIVFIDEIMDDSDYTYLNSIPTAEIAMIKVIRNSMMIPFANFKPVIAVYLNKAYTYSPYKNKPDIPSKRLMGYPKLIESQQVDYSDTSKNTSGYDTRSVLYWGTSFVPEKDLAKIQFYNNDLDNDLIMTVVGFSSTGIPVFLKKEIKK